MTDWTDETKTLAVLAGYMLVPCPDPRDGHPRYHMMRPTNHLEYCDLEVEYLFGGPINVPDVGSSQ